MHLYEGRANAFRVHTISPAPFATDVYLRDEPTETSSDLSLPVRGAGNSLVLNYNSSNLKPDAALERLIRHLTPELSAYLYAEYCDGKLRAQARSLQSRAKKLLDDSAGVSALDGYRTRLSSLTDLNGVMSDAGETRILWSQLRDWIAINTVPGVLASTYQISQDHLSRILQRDATTEIVYADRAVEHLDSQRRIDYQLTIAGVISLVATILALLIHFL